MKTKVRKWGNSLAVRIPKSFAEEAHLAENAPVEVTLEEGRIVLCSPQKKHTLKKLLSGINEGNLHREADFGAPAGEETW